MAKNEWKISESTWSEMIRNRPSSLQFPQDPLSRWLLYLLLWHWLLWPWCKAHSLTPAGQGADQRQRVDTDKTVEEPFLAHIYIILYYIIYYIIYYIKINYILNYILYIISYYYIIYYILYIIYYILYSIYYILYSIYYILYIIYYILYII